MSDRAPIFTKHALERMALRSVSREHVLSVLTQPDTTVPTEKSDTVKYIRQLQDRHVQVVATYLADQKRWLIISVWVRGEEDPVPFIWQVVTLPFKVVWWLSRWFIRSSLSYLRRKR